MKPVLLAILDGVGVRDEIHGNALKQANMPHFDALWKQYPHSLLKASGSSVGLPEGQMGNSEVGHMTIGAGRVIYQPLEQINRDLENHTLFQKQAFTDIKEHIVKNHSHLHVLCLLSDGGVHSHINHLFSLLDWCKAEDLSDVRLHVLTDGRDTLVTSGIHYVQQLEKKLQELEIGKIVTICGRYYTMDRDNRWDRIKKGYDVLVNGSGALFDDAVMAIQTSYEKGITDEFIEPIILDPDQTLQDDDCLLVFNFRPDRLREIGYALTNPLFQEFEVKELINLKMVTMYPISSDSFSTPIYSQHQVPNTLGEVVSKYGKRQLRIAETEKYNHVTYFFDGEKKIDYDGEYKILIPSPRIATYDLDPKMSAYQITDTLLREMDQYDLIILNFANGDMLGHTGNLKATIDGLEVVDECLGKIKEKIDELDGILLVTADHGNCEFMLDDEDHIITSHTTSLVPFIINQEDYCVKNGTLADLAPTILALMDLPIPDEMTGSLLVTK